MCITDLMNAQGTGHGKNNKRVPGEWTDGLVILQSYLLASSIIYNLQE